MDPRSGKSSRAGGRIAAEEETRELRIERLFEEQLALITAGKPLDRKRLRTEHGDIADESAGYDLAIKINSHREDQP